jgi:hypothetical protein
MELIVIDPKPGGAFIPLSAKMRVGGYFYRCGRLKI